MMVWNLTDAISIPGERSRGFALPLANPVPPKWDPIVGISDDLFEFSEKYRILPAPDGRTSHISLNIKINPPPGVGFADTPDGLPNPLVRLHAMAPGILSFKPAEPMPSPVPTEPTPEPIHDRLILTMPFFMGLIFKIEALFFRPPHAPWWQRWIDADCYPFRLIYDNVDMNYIRTLLQAIPLASGLPALSLPREVTTEAERNNFINNFLLGDENYILTARPGAIIGKAAPHPYDTTGPSLLKLHARYYGHVDDLILRPMNPREFFYLLFGNDSSEAINHPLLRSMNRHGTQQPESKRMLLRPPLRTHARLIWEGEQEINNHSNNWRSVGILGPDRFYNTHSRDGHRFNNGPYNRAFKCNLFVSDICLRAGFRINIHDASPNTWHYVDANTYCNTIHITGPLPSVPNQDFIPVMGVAEDRNVVWAWKIENWLRQPGANVQQKLNDAMRIEGRCFIIAGTRPRRFRNTPDTCNMSNGVCDCRASLGRGIGHIAIIREVLGPPQLTAAAGDGFRTVTLRTMEASGTNGAVDINQPIWTLGGAGANPAAHNAFIRLHIFELHPGKDPDTIQGLRDLNIRGNAGRTNLRRTDETASRARLNFYTNGLVRNDNMCCFDQWPASDTAVQQMC